MIEGLKRGQFVTWVYKPEDPDGPYGWMVNNFRPNNHLKWCRIYWALWRYAPPPYKVLDVFYLDTKDRLVSEPQDGFLQMVRLEVEVVRGQDIGVVKPRLYGGMLFKRVPEPLVPWLMLEYIRLGDKLNLEYMPPPT